MTAKHAVHVGAVVIRIMWRGGQRLKICPLTERSWRLVRKTLWGRPPKSLKQLKALVCHRYGFEMRALQLYYAEHLTGDYLDRKPGVHVVERPLFKYKHLQLKSGWWIGMHVAAPTPLQTYLTMPFGILDELLPPKVSQKWALRVDSFTSKAAKDWARGPRRKSRPRRKRRP